jgi:lipopolysaccharide export LptBFGC system permease protein LptF
MSRHSDKIVTVLLATEQIMCRLSNRSELTIQFSGGSVVFRFVKFVKMYSIKT